MARKTGLGALAVPTTTLPNAGGGADSAVGFTPVAVSGTRLMPVVEVVEIDKEPAGTAPSAVGVDVREIVQLACAASEVEQVPPETAYSAGGVIELIVTAVACVLLRVTTLAGLIVLIGTLPKATAAGETVVCAEASAADSRLRTVKEANTKDRIFRKPIFPSSNIVLPLRLPEFSIRFSLARTLIKAPASFKVSIAFV